MSMSSGQAQDMRPAASRRRLFREPPNDLESRVPSEKVIYVNALTFVSRHTRSDNEGFGQVRIGDLSE